MEFFCSVYAVILHFLLPNVVLATPEHDPSVNQTTTVHNQQNFHNYPIGPTSRKLGFQELLKLFVPPRLSDNDMCNKCEGRGFCKSYSNMYCLSRSIATCDRREVRKCISKDNFNRNPGSYSRYPISVFDPMVYSPHHGPICFATGMRCSSNGKCCDYEAHCTPLEHTCCKDLETDCIYHRDCCGDNACVNRRCCRKNRSKCSRNLQCCSRNCESRRCRPVMSYNNRYGRQNRFA